MHIIALMRNYTFSSGGVQKNARELYLNLAKRGVDITILANSKQCEKKVSYKDGPLTVIPVPFPDLYYRPYRIKHLKFFIRKRKLIHQIKANIQASSIIVSHWIQEGILLGNYTRNLPVKKVYNCHGQYAAKHFVRFTTKNNYWGSKLKSSNLGLDLINTMSLTMKSYLNENIQNLNLPITTIYNAVDVKKYESPRKDLKSKKHWIFCFVGRLVPCKHLDIVIHALSEFRNHCLKEIHVLIAGTGPEQFRLEKLASELRFENNIHFRGYIKDIPGFLKAADFYISASSVEGMPNAPLEAMASGLVPILSDIGPHREILNDANAGFIFETNKMPSLIEKLKSLETSNLAAMADNSIKRVVDTFSIDTKTEKYYQLFSDLIK